MVPHGKTNFTQHHPQQFDEASQLVSSMGLNIYGKNMQKHRVNVSKALNYRTTTEPMKAESRMIVFCLPHFRTSHDLTYPQMG
jgi:hypothetical protein